MTDTEIFRALMVSKGSCSESDLSEFLLCSLCPVHKLLNEHTCTIKLAYEIALQEYAKIATTEELLEI
jgi:hypothetical protein